MKTIKPSTAVARLPGDWEEQQYERAKVGCELVLPPEQVKFVHPLGPGKREDGQLWFEGASRRSIAGDKVSLAKFSMQRLQLDGTELPMRDFRKGDKWLPWHFKEKS